MSLRGATDLVATWQSAGKRPICSRGIRLLLLCSALGKMLLPSSPQFLLVLPPISPTAAPQGQRTLLQSGSRECVRKNTCCYIYPNTTFYFFNHILPHGTNDHEGWWSGRWAVVLIEYTAENACCHKLQAIHCLLHICFF